MELALFHSQSFTHLDPQFTSTAIHLKMQFFKGLSTYFVASAMLAQVAYAFSGDGTFY
jgi:hypothetical protein